MPPTPLILASTSPRRSALLRELSIPFEVVTAEVTELTPDSAPSLTPANLAAENARRKAQAVSLQRPEAWILGADTVVVLKGRVFGKPTSLEEAMLFLQAFSGQKHEVITACALIEPSNQQHHFHEVTEVVFKTLSPEIIERYLAHVHVLDKAGAYALQEHGEWIVERVDGSRNNVIGLPTERLVTYFRAAGLL